jgi:hypothetical protein
MKRRADTVLKKAKEAARKEKATVKRELRLQRRQEKKSRGAIV